MLRGSRLGCLMGVLVAVSVASPAHAGLSVWTGLPGLDAGNGAQWIRDFQFESFPPTTGTTAYAATEGQGVFRSQFGGAAWSPFNNGLEDISAKYVRTLLVSGTDVYAGTDLGVFKSEGGGQWKPLAQGPEESPANPKKLNESVQSLVSVPGGTMLAGVFSGGVFRSTDDGKTWTPPAPGNGMPAHQTVTSIVSFPFLPGGPVFAASGTGIYRSFDSGATWTLASDGIGGGASPNFLWVDSNRPNVHYAGTGASGMYRSTNSGLTWHEINTGFGAVRTRGLQIFTGDDGAVLYAATEEALWAGRVPGAGTSPPPPTWRQVTTSGLGNNTIMWSLTAPSVPGVGGAPGLFAGTQSNGGYFLTFEPPDSACPTPATAHAACPKITDEDGNAAVVQEGKTLKASRGTWTGTEPVDRAIQWQRCTGVNTGCTDIPNETAETYVITEDDFDDGIRFRVEITATNPFPSFDLIQRFSLTTAATTANPNNLPGASQTNAPTIDVLSPGQDSSPKVGDTLYAELGTQPSPFTDGWFNPKATSHEFQWLRCSGFIQTCRDIPGATDREYTLVTGDGNRSFKVRVTGTNNAGSTELTSPDTNEVISAPAEATENPQLFGDAYPGETLTGTVGAWKDPSTGFRRQWLRCDADGQFCTFIQEIGTGDPETGPSYTVREEDLGYVLKMRVIADVNGDITDGLDNAAPSAVEVDTAPSAVVAPRPLPPPPPIGGGTPSGDGGSGPGPAGVADTLAPGLTALSLTNRRFVVGSEATATIAGRRTPKGTVFRFRLSEPATAALTIERRLPGRKVGRKCRAPSRKLRKRKKCTRAKRAGVLTRRDLPAGAAAVPFSGRIGKKKLAPGSYQVKVVATDAAGNKSRAAIAPFTVVRR